MIFQLKTSKETLNLAFNAYFVHRACQLADKELSDIFNYLLGKNISTDKENPNVNGGLINSMDVRAVVIAAGIDAYNRKNKVITNTSVDEAFEYLDNIALIDGQFAELYGGLIGALLPNAVAAPKSVAAKAAKKQPSKK